MIWIERPQTDPWFNLAAEEFVLRHFTEDVLMFWQNTPSVVVGKHQNTLAEVNMDFVQANQIPVIRRISGGGTVFHDLGNINYTLIRSVEKDSMLVDFRKFTQPLRDFLETVGLEAYFEGKNNLRVQGKKFSGNAAHVFKQRVMHHGTILFDTDLKVLEKVIQPSQEQYFDKGIKSINAEVTNISTLLLEKTSLKDFKKLMTDFFKDYFQIVDHQRLGADEVESIEKLAASKYKTWEWNVGYSPKYTLQKEVDTAYGRLKTKLYVEAGIIQDITLFIEEKKLIKIENQLKHQPHRKAVLLKLLATDRFSETLVNTLF